MATPSITQRQTSVFGLPAPPPYPPPHEADGADRDASIVTVGNGSLEYHHIPPYVPTQAQQGVPFGQHQPHINRHQGLDSPYQGINLMQQPSPSSPAPQFPPPPSSSTSTPVTSAPFALGGPTTYPYVSVAGEKRTRVLLAPQSGKVLYTVVYPSSLSPVPRIVITRNDGSELATVTIHNISTGKVNVSMSYGGPGGAISSYRFEKKFESQTGLGTKKLVWGKEKGGARDLVLVEGGLLKDDKATKWKKKMQKKKKEELNEPEVQGNDAIEHEAAGAEQGESVSRAVIARFVPRGGKVDGSDRIEGWFDMCRPGGLDQKQFEEVFVSAVADIERRRRDSEDWEIIETVLAIL